MSTARTLENDLQQATGVNICPQTTRNRLHEGSLRGQCSLVSPGLTALAEADLQLAVELAGLPLMSCAVHR